jgi:hypothetical protein
METIMMKDQNFKNVSKKNPGVKSFNSGHSEGFKSLDESGTQKSKLKNICGLQDIPI